MTSMFRDTGGALEFDEAVRRKIREMAAASAQITEHATHHFILTRTSGRNIKVTAERREGKVTQSYVNEIAAHISKVEADPVYSAPQPYKRWPQ
jgi:hypothetical protein